MFKKTKIKKLNIVYTVHTWRAREPQEAGPSNPIRTGICLCSHSQSYMLEKCKISLEYDQNCLFQNVLREKDRNIHLNNTFPLKIARISLQKQNFQGMRFPNSTFCPCVHLHISNSFVPEICCSIYPVIHHHYFHLHMHSGTLAYLFLNFVCIIPWERLWRQHVFQRKTRSVAHEMRSCVSSYEFKKES